MKNLFIIIILFFTSFPILNGNNIYNAFPTTLNPNKQSFSKKSIKDIKKTIPNTESKENIWVQDSSYNYIFNDRNRA